MSREPSTTERRAGRRNKVRRKKGQRRAGDYQTSNKEEKKTDKTLVQGGLEIEGMGRPTEEMAQHRLGRDRKLR